MTLRLILLALGLSTVIPLTGFMTVRWTSMGKDWVQPTVIFGILNAFGTVLSLGMWNAIRPRLRLSAGVWLVVSYLLVAVPFSVIIMMAEHRGLWGVSPQTIERVMSLFMMSLFVMVSPLTLLILIGGAAVASQTTLLATNVAANALFYFLIGVGFERWVVKSHG
ncbi:MAG: hypothetical protein HY595_05870 [Candidatus Omnitrophica bacterium]|nr:hypothetical protein [Candidatus Omnitrophota bacterium]